jgi:FAD/FMN-containing dehydrogenase
MGILFSKPPPPTVKPRDESRVAKAAKHVQPIQAHLQALDDKIQGDVYLAGDTSKQALYHKQRERPFYFNDANYPSAIIMPNSKEDVSEAIKTFGTILDKHNNNYTLAVAGGCHSSYCMVDNAIVIDLERMDAAKVDKEAKTLSLQGGAKIAVGNDALKGTNLGFMTGTNGDTGVSGLTLAGGAGYLGGQAGFACDTVVSAEVVLPTGEIVTATDDNQHKDLLRALRGGGGNFGIVTEWTFRLFDVTHCMAGTVVHFAPTVYSLTTVLANFASHYDDMPDQAAALFAIPVGAPVFVSVYTMIGDSVKDKTSYTEVPFLKEASYLGAWFRLSNDLGPKDYYKDICPLLEPVQQRTYATAIGAMVYSFDEKMRDALVHFARIDVPLKNTKPLILLQNLSGEMRRNDGSRSSLRHRKAVAWIIVEAGWEPYATDEQIASVKDWAVRCKAKILELGGEDGPHNFTDTDGRRIKFFTDEQRTFLEQAKKKYDPKNMFVLNKNIIASHSE